MASPTLLESPVVTLSDGQSGTQEWDDYVARAPLATLCHLSGWVGVISSTWGHSSHSLLAKRHGSVCGVLPLVHVASPLFGSMLVSTPAAIYGGALADDSETRAALVGSARQLAIELGVDYLEL